LTETSTASSFTDPGYKIGESRPSGGAEFAMADLHAVIERHVTAEINQPASGALEYEIRGREIPIM